MKNYFCNPINVCYRYQFNNNPMAGGVDINREAADPSMILFKGRYYIFASMTLSVWVSDDLSRWESHRLPEQLPLYGYAPDIRVMGDYVYYCSNRESGVCDFYRTQDILNGPYEKIPGTFNFSDPNLFWDEDDRVYFYWGLSSTTPIWGVELDKETMHPIGQKEALVWSDPFHKGFERIGEDNITLPCSEEELNQRYADFLLQKGVQDESSVDPFMAEMLRSILRDAPFIEGAWMNKHQGKYYLQYAFAGTQYNIYGDGVYVSDHPLGPFSLARNNPYSYKPGGFIPGAGHGSTMWDKYDNVWHAATMRISMNHQFERRVGIWMAGVDKDGELFCNQRYGDWPMMVENGENTSHGKSDPWKNPDWYLLSFNKPVKASSYEAEKGPEKAADENVRTWWRAENNSSGEWIQMDLQKPFTVHAIQINFADDKIEAIHSIDEKYAIEGAHSIEEKFSEEHSRYIEERDLATRWILEGSLDEIEEGHSMEYFVIEDKSKAITDLPHDLIVIEEGLSVRYLRLTILEVPYNQKPCISGLRVFGYGEGDKPLVPDYKVTKTGETDMEVTICDNGSVGYNILWGHSPKKLYHSYMVFNSKKRIGALVKGENYYVRVDAFNESGITEGTVKEVV